MDALIYLRRQARPKDAKHTNRDHEDQGQDYDYGHNHSPHPLLAPISAIPTMHLTPLIGARSQEKLVQLSSRNSLLPPATLVTP